jgi:hypothetical protein
LQQVTAAAGSTRIFLNAVIEGITVLSGETVGLPLQLRIERGLTASGQSITAADLTPFGVMINGVLPRKTSWSIGDVTGVVISVDSAAQTLTIQTAMRGPITATTNSATIYSALCGTSNSFACVKQGSTASVELGFNSDFGGKLTAVGYDPLDMVAGDILEGVVTSAATDSTHFQIVTTDVNFTTASSRLSGKINLGDPVNITLALPVPSSGFEIDDRGLTIPANTFRGSTDASVLQPGQTLALFVKAFAPRNGGTPASATVDRVILRFTPVTATVSSVASPFVTLTGFAPYLGIAGSAQAQVTNGVTIYESVLGVTGLTVGDTVSVRALYFGTRVSPAFSVAKLRSNYPR